MTIFVMYSKRIQRLKPLFFYIKRLKMKFQFKFEIDFKKVKKGFKLKLKAIASLSKKLLKFLI